MYNQFRIHTYIQIRSVNIGSNKVVSNFVLLKNKLISNLLPITKDFFKIMETKDTMIHLMGLCTYLN